MMRRILAFALMPLLCITPALAQTADAPVMGSAAIEEEAAVDEASQVTDILVLGDAVGGGLGAGLTRMADIDGRYEVALRFNEESGLARPEVYDWKATLPKILESNSYDVIVVMLGSNDRQMIRSGNERHAFNSPGWIEAYKTQIDMVLDELAESGADVYWVSLPPMANSEYDAAMKAITDLQRERVEARGMNFLDIRPEFSNPDGSYTDMGKDDTGEVRKLRGKDGISFFKQGNNRLGQLVLEAIARGKTAAPKTAKVSLPETTSVQRPEISAAREVPLFGQIGIMGDIVTLRPKDVVMNASLVVGGAETLPPAAALEAIRAMAPQGSSAEKLFRLGQAPDAPKGRADDFSVPPAQAN
jgi:hypothetical protein